LIAYLEGWFKMGEVIYWNNTGINTRMAVAELAGWCTKKGKITQTGKRIANTQWEELSPAAQNVLSRHGIKPTLN
jgi:hypothetical protein